MDAKQKLIALARELGHLSADAGDTYDVVESFIEGYATAMAETARNTPAVRHELVKLSDLGSAVSTVIEWRVDDAREAGQSWDWIADALDLTRQTVWRKYRKTDDPAF